MIKWNEKLQNIIDYVENHLQINEEEISNEEIARLAGCSFGFFQKVFSYMNKMSFADYVRYRKLTLAGYDLKSTNMKIVDISYKYGYDSPTSFTKAFSQFHGITPKQAKDIGSDLTIVPKMQILNKQKYTWRIEEKNDLNLVGLSRKLFLKDGSLYDQIPKVWSDIQKDGSYTKLMNLDMANQKGIFGFCIGYDEKMASIDYSIMVISDKEAPDGFIKFKLPKATWAVFDCIGAIPNSIQSGWKYLNEEWLVKYPFKHDTHPDLEWYSDKNQYSDDYLSQIWIPILKEEY